MNKRIHARVLAGILVFATAGAALAQQNPPKPEQLIKWRQSAYQVLAWNQARIKANVEGQFNKEEVIRAANSTAAIANSGLGALYAPGTETGKGWRDTTVKPELFSDTKGAAEAAGAFTREANELARVAATGDVAAIKAQFGKVGQTCKGCHDDYRRKD